MIRIFLYLLLVIALGALYILSETEGWFIRELPDTQERIAHSPNFDPQTGKAKNIENTTQLFSVAKGDQQKRSAFRIMYELFFNPDKPQRIPVVSGSLKNLPTEDCVVWLGHSSLLLRLNGKTILIDPLLENEAASPISWINTPFNGTDVFAIQDLPQEIDLLLITHDHYDHLGKKTIQKMARHKNIHRAIAPLGVGKYLHHYGIHQDKITQVDWGDEVVIDDDLKIDVLTTRHFSGRGMTNKNKTLWASYLLHDGKRKIYIGGDSGYGAHFKAIGKRYQKIDLAFLENGQYDAGWREIHMFPEQTFQAALDLNTAVLMPIHNSKYKISYHAWDAPMKDLKKIVQKQSNPMQIITPKIGEIVPLQGEYISEAWWEK